MVKYVLFLSLLSSETHRLSSCEPENEKNGRSILNPEFIDSLSRAFRDILACMYQSDGIGVQAKGSRCGLDEVIALIAGLEVYF
jgi:hypothetical protein